MIEEINVLYDINHTFEYLLRNFGITIHMEIPFLLHHHID